MKNFLTPLAPSGPLHSKKFQKTLILAFEANSALSHENQTEIVKIKHSSQVRVRLELGPKYRYLKKLQNLNCFGINLFCSNSMYRFEMFFQSYFLGTRMVANSTDKWLFTSMCPDMPNHITAISHYSIAEWTSVFLSIEFYRIIL